MIGRQPALRNHADVFGQARLRQQLGESRRKALIDIVVVVCGNTEISTAMIVMTTSSSISGKADRRGRLDRGTVIQEFLELVNNHFH